MSCPSLDVLELASTNNYSQARVFFVNDDDDDEVMLNVLRCQLTY